MMGPTRGRMALTHDASEGGGYFVDESGRQGESLRDVDEGELAGLEEGLVDLLRDAVKVFA
jgi:hypothetical protein